MTGGNMSIPEPPERFSVLSAVMQVAGDGGELVHCHWWTAITVKFGIFLGDCFGRNAAGFFLKKTKRNPDYFSNPAIYITRGSLRGSGRR
jgi:hypothetical protein